MDRILNNIRNLTESVEYKTQLLGRNQRLLSGVSDTQVSGFFIGFIITILIIGLPIIYFKGGF